ncbi:MAG: hypothetical protein M3Y59_18815 [Myxococcota bacterium]|nr:hypothetical protein [Myxococcota bacterium]
MYGFFRWFDAAKRGLPEGLRAMEQHLFEQLRDPAPPPPRKEFRWFLE